jgi:hypothetical protein
MRRGEALLSLATALAPLFLCRDASALGPVDLEVAAKVGAGTNPEGGSGSPDPLGFGVGGRAGVSFFHVYAGVNVMNYFGSSGSFGGVPISQHSLQYGVEVGYGFSLSILTLRPQVGVGNFVVYGGGSESSGVTTLSVSTNGHILYVEPGVTAIVPFGIPPPGASRLIRFVVMASTDPVVNTLRRATVRRRLRSGRKPNDGSRARD